MSPNVQTAPAPWRGALLRLVLAGLAAVAGWGAWQVHTLRYEHLLARAEAQNAALDAADTAFAHHLRADILPHDAFARLQTGAVWASALLALLGVVLALWPAPLVRLGRWLASVLGQLRALVAETWAALPTGERWTLGLLVAGVVALRLLLAAWLPPTADEANVYTTFVRHGPLVSWVYYPIPSNHVLHTLLWGVLDWGPMAGVWAGRLPVVLAGGLTVLLFYLLARRWAGVLGAWVGGLVLATGYAEYVYGVLARGYGLTMLACLTAYAALHVLRRRPRHRGAWLLLTVAVAVGICVLPGFYVAAAALLAAGIWDVIWAPATQRLPLLRAGLSAGFWAVVLSLLFYTPLLLWGGWPAPRIGPIDGQLPDLPAYWAELRHVAGLLTPLKLPDDAYVYDARPYIALALATVVLWVWRHPARLRLWAHVVLMTAVSLALLPAFQGYVAPAKVYTFLMPFWLGVVVAAAGALADGLTPATDAAWAGTLRRWGGVALAMVLAWVNLAGGAQHYRHHFATDLAAAQLAHQALHPPCHCTLAPRNEAEHAVLRYYQGHGFQVQPP